MKKSSISNFTNKYWGSFQYLTKYGKTASIKNVYEISLTNSADSNKNKFNGLKSNHPISFMNTLESIISINKQYYSRYTLLL